MKTSDKADEFSTVFPSCASSQSSSEFEESFEDTVEGEGEADEAEWQLSNPKPAPDRFFPAESEATQAFREASTVAQVAAAAPLDPLAALLLRTNKRMDDDKTLKENRKALTDTRVTGKAREEVEQAVRQIELTRDWRARATVAMYQTQICAHCESVNSLFSGLFQREVNKHNHATRWVQVAQIRPELPKETKEAKNVTPMCFDCATEDFGFYLRETAEPAPPPAPIPPSVLFSRLDKPQEVPQPQPQLQL